MPFTAVMLVTPEGKLGKFQEFPTRAKAQAHVDTFIDQFPKAFVAHNPSNRHWEDMVINPTTRVVTFEVTRERQHKDAPVVAAIRLLAEDASPGTRAQVLALFA